MKSRQLERFISEWCPRSPADIDARGRELRNAALVPVGGRGPHAPELEASHIATWLLAICGARKAVDAADAVKELAPLVAVGDKRFAGAVDLLGAVTKAVAAHQIAKTVKRIVFWHRPERAADFVRWFPAAEITWAAGKSDRTALYVPPNIAKEMIRGGAWGRIMFDCTIIGTGLLVELAVRFERDDDDDAEGIVFQ